MRFVATLCVLGMLLVVCGCGGSSRGQPTTNVGPSTARQRRLREARDDAAAQPSGPTNYRQIARAALQAMRLETMRLEKKEEQIQASRLPLQQKKQLLRVLRQDAKPCTPEQAHQLEQAAEPSKPGLRVSVDCAKRFP